jgi:hypothetical protein
MKLLAPDVYNRSGALLVDAGASGAEVIVDGVMRGTTPLFGPIDGLPPGRRDVEVKLAGTKSWRGFVDVGFDEAYRLDLAVKDGALVEVPHGGGSVGNGGGGPDGELPVFVVAGTAALAVGVIAALAAGGTGLAVVDAHDKIVNKGETTTANLDAYMASAVACGTLTALAAVGLAGGGVLMTMGMAE